MQIPVLIEPITGVGYRARGGEPFALVVEARTREEALAKLKEQLQARLQNGAEVVAVDLNCEAHPLAGFAGMFKDDPMLEEWKKAMAAYRRQIDRTPERP